MHSFVIPAEYCVALIDTDAYPSFVHEDWDETALRRHFVTQMKGETMLAWGTGASANWRIQVLVNPEGASEAVPGFRNFTGRVRATGSRLFLTSYDELTFVAGFTDERLPREGTETWFISIAPGEYDCRVTQLYDPAEAESEEVFNQQTPHFRIEISAADKTNPAELDDIPWFPGFAGGGDEEFSKELDE